MALPAVSLENLACFDTFTGVDSWRPYCYRFPGWRWNCWWRWEFLFEPAIRWHSTIIDLSWNAITDVSRSWQRCFFFFFFDIYWRAAAATEWLESNNMTDICCRCCVQFLAFKRERERERKRGGEGKERKKDGKKDRK